MEQRLLKEAQHPSQKRNFGSCQATQKAHLSVPLFSFYGLDGASARAFHALDKLIKRELGT